MTNIEADLDRLREKLTSEEFLLGKGLSNEVNIHIFCYEAEDEMTVRHFLDFLSKKDFGVKIKIINLYHKLIELCEKKKIIKSIPSMEERKGREFLLNELSKLTADDQYLEMFDYRPEEDEVVLFTGVGEVYPFIRVHNLLERIQPYISKIPMVVIYPGTFENYQLRLFGKFEPSDYYRAFNII